MTVEDTDQTVAPERVAELVAGGEVELVDVRTAAEYEAGHVAGARHVPFDELAARSQELDRSRPLVLYCRGGARSGAATQAFAASGWQAESMAGGLAEWVARGHPLEPDDGRVADTTGLPDQPTST